MALYSPVRNLALLPNRLHVKSAPYNLASNGLVEQAVQTFKEFMKKMKDVSIKANVSHSLFQLSD